MGGGTRKSAGLGGRNPDLDPVDSIASSATLAESHKLSEPQFSYLQNGDIRSRYLRIRIK